MAALTLTQQFGANATLNSGVLSISLADLASVGLSGSATNPADIAAALVLFWKSATPSNYADDNTIGLAVTDSFTTKTFVSRNSVSQIEYQYTVSAYVADTTANTLDPDNIV